MNAVEIADVLDKAADLLWIKGRITGRFHDDDGAMCLGAAFAEAAQGTSTKDYYNLYSAVCDYLGTLGYMPSIICFNDSLPVCPENDALVTDTLRRAAKELREQATCS